MAGQARVAEEGLEAEVTTGARVVPVEQEGREQTPPHRGNRERPPLARELCEWAPLPRDFVRVCRRLGVNICGLYRFKRA